MRVLVTGGSGFVGNQLVRRLLADGHEVSLILRRDARTWRLTDVRDSVTVYAGDLADADFVKSVLKQATPGWVFSSAAYGAYSSETDVGKMMRTNVTGLHNLLDASNSANVEAFINVASCFEYGETDGAPIEDTRCSPSTDYGISRMAGTALCRDWSARTGIRATTLRLYSTYGPLEDPQRLITRLCRSALRREQPALKPESATHDYTYIDDVVGALISSAKAPHPESYITLAPVS